MKKRILSLVLAVVMVFSVLPIHVFAEVLDPASTPAPDPILVEFYNNDGSKRVQKGNYNYEGGLYNDFQNSFGLDSYKLQNRAMGADNAENPTTFAYLADGYEAGVIGWATEPNQTVPTLTEETMGTAYHSATVKRVVEDLGLAEVLEENGQKVVRFYAVYKPAPVTVRYWTPADELIMKVSKTFTNPNKDGNTVGFMAGIVDKANALAPTGYILQGWTFEKNGTAANITKNSHELKEIVDTYGAELKEEGGKLYIDVYAVWERNEFTITFHTKGGTEIEPITAIYGDTITAPDDPTRAGFVFDCWDQEIPETMPAEDMTITAKWKRTVEFNPNGGMFEDDSTANKIVVCPSSSINNVAVPAVTRDGYAFLGWFNEADELVIEAGKSFYSVYEKDSGMVLHAEWECIHPNANGYCEEYNCAHDENECCTPKAMNPIIEVSYNPVVDLQPGQETAELEVTMTVTYTGRDKADYADFRIDGEGTSVSFDSFDDETLPEDGIYTYTTTKTIDVGYNLNDVRLAGNVWLKDADQKVLPNVGHAYAYGDKLEVRRVDLADATITLEPDSYVYNGNDNEPVVTVAFGSVIVPESEYTVVYSGNVDAGTATVTVTAVADSMIYEGTQTATFNIAKADADLTITTPVGVIYDGEAHPVIDTLTGVDGQEIPGAKINIKYEKVEDGVYTAVDGAPVDAGEYVVTVHYAGNKNYNAIYQWRAYTYTIAKADPVINVSFDDIIYNGAAYDAYTAEVVGGDGNVIAGAKIDIAFGNVVNGAIAWDTFVKDAPVNAGIYTARVYYGGDANHNAACVNPCDETAFEITPADINTAEITLTPDAYVYNGNANEPAVTVVWNGTTLVQDTDYTVAYGNNINAGAGSVVITGIGNFTNEVNKTFTINPADLVSVTLKPTNVRYNGKAQTVEVTVIGVNGTVLTEGTDYTVTYRDNVAPGKADVIVTGIGNYTGVITKNFVIYNYAATYRVNVKSDEIKSSHRTAKAGESVYLTMLGDASIDDVIVTDKHGEELEIKKDKKGYYFKMPASDVTVSLQCEVESSFIDVNTNDYFFNAVEWAVENGITNGMTWNTFAPDGFCNRAQAVTFLWRAAGRPEAKTSVMPFNDVAEGTWYYDAVLWAVENGITKGMSDTEFAPDVTVTREQMITILWRYAQHKHVDVSIGEETNILSYGDAFDIAHYAIPAMQWACGSGMVNGMEDGKGGMILNPQGITTRAQMVTMLMRFCVDIEK